MRVAVMGGDGFCGWPTSLRLSEAGHEIVIIDNLARRKADVELGVESLTPITTVRERIDSWKEVTGRTIEFVNLDIAQDYEVLRRTLGEIGPEAIIHYAEQRSAPHSMRTPQHKVYTVDNNVNATHNILAAVVQEKLDPHIVHLGTMGVYGYSGSELPIPEGYLPVRPVSEEGHALEVRDVLYPSYPGSIYHMTKVLDQHLFAFYARNDNLRITDLHQGIVWGTQIPETQRDPRLINRFDYDGDYGTVLNRFLMQAAIRYPLTVHGSGGQTRAFIHITDSARCIELALADPPERGERVRIRNQMTETHSVRGLAQLVSDLSGAEIAYLENPRNEAGENDLAATNKSFLDLGLEPTLLHDGLLSEVIDIAGKYAERCDRSLIPCTSRWINDKV